MITEKEAQIDNMQKEIFAKDDNIKRQDAEIQAQGVEIEGLKVDIEKKNEEIGRCNQQIMDQQTTINELQAKLPSIDLIQVKNI